MEKLGHDILEKLGKAKARFDELTDLVLKPEILADNREYKKLSKERASLEEIAAMYDTLSGLVSDYEKCQEDYEKESDSELKNLFYDEIGSLKKQIEEKIEQAKILLLPRDENDDNNCIIGIRSAAGGEESSLFCAVLTYSASGDFFLTAFFVQS